MKINLNEEKQQITEKKEENEEKYLESCYERIFKLSKDIENEKYIGAQETIELIEKDLNLVSNLKVSLSAKTEFFLFFLKIFSHILKVKNISSIKKQHFSLLFEISYSIENLFLGNYFFFVHIFFL